MRGATRGWSAARPARRGALVRGGWPPRRASKGGQPHPKSRLPPPQPPVPRPRRRRGWSASRRRPPTWPSPCWAQPTRRGSSAWRRWPAGPSCSGTRRGRQRARRGRGCRAAWRRMMRASWPGGSGQRASRACCGTWTTERPGCASGQRCSAACSSPATRYGPPRRSSRTGSSGQVCGRRCGPRCSGRWRRWRARSAHWKAASRPATRTLTLSWRGCGTSGIWSPCTAAWWRCRPPRSAGNNRRANAGP